MADPSYLSTDPNAGISLSDDVASAQSHVQAGSAVPHPIVQRLLSWLPTAEGMIGGVIGGAGGGAFGLGVGGIPGAIGGAALGGAAGEAQRQLLNRLVGNTTPSTSASAASDIGASAVEQGASQAAGEAVVRPIAAAAKAVAPSLMRSAIQPSLKAMESAGEVETGAELPRAVSATLQSGGSVTPSGVRTLAAARDAATTAKDAIIANLNGKVAPGAVQQMAQGYADTLAVASDQKAAQRVLDQFTDQYVRDPQTGQMRQWLDPIAADTLKTQYRYGANFGTMSKPAGQMRKVIASGLKDGLEALDTTKTLASANATAGALIDATKAAGKANALWLNKPLALRALAALRGTSPAVNSMLANGMYTQAASVAKWPVNTVRALVTVLADPEPEAHP